jgi:L-seryl-tRNA(Ser) seleniumtransferase
MTILGGGGIYESLGIRPVINAQGNATVLGGSTPPPEVQAAMDQAGLNFVEMKELLAKSGEFIAGVLGTESAYVTSGCAAALTLSTAACVTGTDPDKIARLPDTTGMKNEVLIQKKHRYSFDRCYTLPGCKLIEVGNEEGCTPEQLDEAIGPDTAAVAYFVQADWDSSVVSLEDTVEIAHRHNVPVIADAASQIYPLERFRELAQTADLVCFGAKYFGAPHSSGILSGRKDLVDAAVANGFIAFHFDGNNAFGRAMKLDRQEIVGAVAALDRWFSMNHEDRILGYDRRMSTIQEGLRGVPTLQSKVISQKRKVGTTYHQSLYPGAALQVVIDPETIGKTAPQVADELDAGNPRIWLYTEGVDTFVINVHTLNEGDEQVIADRLRSALTS